MVADPVGWAGGAGVFNGWCSRRYFGLRGIDLGYGYTGSEPGQTHVPGAYFGDATDCGAELLPTASRGNQSGYYSWFGWYSWRSYRQYPIGQLS